MKFHDVFPALKKIPGISKDKVSVDDSDTSDDEDPALKGMNLW